MKLSLGQAARAAGMSKSTLQRQLASGRVAGHQREDGVWEIDQAELQRVIDSRDAPQRGRKVPAAGVTIAAPVEAARPEAVELAVLKAELTAARQRIEDMIKRAEDAEAREAAERARSDRMTRLIEDQRPARGLWARLTNRDR